MTEEIIMHFGVKGMKWGVRKSQDSIPKKSAHRIRTEASFMAKGCSPSEAAARADKVIRTQKKRWLLLLGWPLRLLQPLRLL